MMTPDERRAYEAEIDIKINAAADRVYLKDYGRTYRPNERMTRPAEKNGDSAGEIAHDFEALFGGDN